MHKYSLSLPAANDVEQTVGQVNQTKSVGTTAQSTQPEVPPIDIVKASFPRIADRIELLWGSWELQQYFTSILISDRGDREGFPIQIVSALLKIHGEHSKIAPTEDPANRHKKNDNLWIVDWANSCRLIARYIPEQPCSRC